MWTCAMGGNLSVGVAWIAGYLLAAVQQCLPLCQPACTHGSTCADLLAVTRNDPPHAHHPLALTVRETLQARSTMRRPAPCASPSAS